jgi:hypothetical protein
MSERKYYLLGFLFAFPAGLGFLSLTDFLSVPVRIAVFLLIGSLSLYCIKLFDGLKNKYSADNPESEYGKIYWILVLMCLGIFGIVVFLGLFVRSWAFVPSHPTAYLLYICVLAAPYLWTQAFMLPFVCWVWGLTFVLPRQKEK